jgi:ribonuclease HI
LDGICRRFLSQPEKWSRRCSCKLNGEKFQYAIKLNFVTTNNEAEYEAVLAGLFIAREMGAKNVEIRSDSQVVVSHVQGVAEAQGEKMIQYLNKVREYQFNFGRTAMTKIPREENVQTDALSKIGLRVPDPMIKHQPTRW